ncbi:MAG: hypothetical protein LKE40_13485 [Spirochaetia bacterium]|jgi:hypothetical protein|nr:hypothetical protein [Spirochaetia bacterium]
MSSYKKHAIVNFVALIITIGINALANILPLGGRTTGEVSGAIDLFITPAPYTFAIWSVIYVALVVVCLQALGRKEATVVLGGDFLASCIANSLWIICWHLLPVQISFFVILLLLFFLYRIARRMVAETTDLGKLFRFTFSVYFGWLTAATLVNFCVFLYAIGVVPSIALTVFLLAIATACALLVLHGWSLPWYALTVAWALFGVCVRNMGKNMVAPIALILCLVLVADVIFQKIRPVTGSSD